jgi:tetratricopeptide (TPR) repeat protein
MLVVLWGTFLTSHLNIGERHLIPAYPPLLILAGGLWRLATARAWRAVVAGLAILHAADTLGRYPALFPYFNQLVPSDRAHWWLVDSNLDWGQGLPSLDRWLSTHQAGSDPVYLAYFGGGLPEQAMPRATVLGKAPAPGAPQRFAPGVYCVSATALQAVWLDLAGRWCEQFEAHYLGLLDRLRAHEAAGGPPLTPGQAAAFNSLQRARLLAFLRHRPPDAIVDRAFLVFRLAAADLAAALDGPPAELDAIAWADTEPVLVARGRVRRAVELWEAGEIAAALTEFQAAATLDPSNADAWAGLARSLAAEGDPDAAAEALRRVEALGGLPAVTVPGLLDFPPGRQPGGPP